MNISPIKTQRDYRNVLKEIEGLMIAKRNTPEGDRLDVLVTLVEAWERKHYPMDLPDPVEAIKYHMDQNGLQPRDLIPFIGSRNRVHEVLNRRRSLTLKMIWRLHAGLGIPAESMIKVGQEHQPEAKGFVTTSSRQQPYVTFAVASSRRVAYQSGTGAGSLRLRGLQPAPEAAGVEFIDDNGGGRGVRLRKPAKEKPRK